MKRSVAGVSCLVLASAMSCTSVPDVHVRPSGSGPSGPGWSASWPQYLFDPEHTSINESATAFSANLHPRDVSVAWTWNPEAATEHGQPPPQLFASPTVVDGTVYIGANTGIFYAIDARTGVPEWQQNLGWVSEGTCGARGITSTAAYSGGTIYVGGGDGKLYALDAIGGRIVWSTRIVEPGREQNRAYLWSSPLVSHGEVFVGVSSQCDHPLIRGGVVAVDAKTGKVDARYWTVPKGQVGGSVWSSVAGDQRHIYVSTGNPDIDVPEGPDWGDSFGLVSFAPPLKKIGAWHLSLTSVKVRDWDFGASPTVWTSGGRTYFGACNKDGNFYAVDAATNDLAWSFQVSVPWPDGSCLGGAVFDGKHLYMAGGKDAQGNAGSVEAVDAGRGTVVWRVALDGPVIGSPSASGAGVVAVPTYGAGLVLVSTSGAKLTTLGLSGNDMFAQPVFSGPYLFAATVQGDLIAYQAGG